MTTLQASFLLTASVLVLGVAPLRAQGFSAPSVRPALEVGVGTAGMSWEEPFNSPSSSETFTRTAHRPSVFMRGGLQAEVVTGVFLYPYMGVEFDQVQGWARGREIDRYHFRSGVIGGYLLIKDRDSRLVIGMGFQKRGILGTDTWINSIAPNGAREWVRVDHSRRFPKRWGLTWNARAGLVFGAVTGWADLTWANQLDSFQGVISVRPNPIWYISPRLALTYAIGESVEDPQP